MPECWGKGYGTESATATIDWAFDNLGWTEVMHTISAKNIESRSLVATLGSHYPRMGYLPAPYEAEVEIRGQAREQWKARPRSGEGA